MRKVKVEEAVGLTLCHDLTEMRDGFKGPAFRRGYVITEADIPHMLDIGKRTVFVWEENAGEIHEEDAALRMAALVAAASVRTRTSAGAQPPRAARLAAMNRASFAQPNREEISA